MHCVLCIVITVTRKLALPRTVRGALVRKSEQEKMLLLTRHPNLKQSTRHVSLYFDISINNCWEVLTNWHCTKQRLFSTASREVLSECMVKRIMKNMNDKR